MSGYNVGQRPKWQQSKYDCPECGSLVWISEQKDVAKCDQCGRRREPIHDFWPDAVKEQILTEEAEVSDSE